MENLTVARINFEKGEPLFFASLDGKSFLNVDREPLADDYPGIVTLFEESEQVNDDPAIGSRVRSGRTKFARRYLEHWGASFRDLGYDKSPTCETCGKNKRSNLALSERSKLLRGWAFHTSADGVVYTRRGVGKIEIPGACDVCGLAAAKKALKALEKAKAEK